MTKDQTQESLRYIREMIEKSKQNTAESGFMLILWAVMPALAIAGMYLLVYLEKYKLIWVNWFVFIGLGFIITIVYRVKEAGRENVKTYAQTAANYLWTGCGVGFILLGFVMPLLKVYDVGVVSIVLAAVAGIGMFTTGGIVDWTLLKACGILWWIGSVAMIFVHENYRALVFLPLILLGYLLPGLILRRGYRKQEACHE